MNTRNYKGGLIGQNQKQTNLFSSDQPSNFTFNSRKYTQTASNYSKSKAKTTGVVQRKKVEDEEEDEVKVKLKFDKKKKVEENKKVEEKKKKSTAEFKSSDFGENPLLSNSKMWKHSPIRNERVKYQVQIDQSPASSVKSTGELNLSVPDEGLSPSPIVKSTIAAVTTRIEDQAPSQFIIPRHGSSFFYSINDPNPRGPPVSNFHDNYLKLGLWPELPFEKQAMLRNSFRNKQHQVPGSKGKGQVLKQNMSYTYLQQSINEVPVNQSFLPPTGRKRIISLMASQESRESSSPYHVKEVYNIQTKIPQRVQSNYQSQNNDESQTRCQRCISVDSYQSQGSLPRIESGQQYKDGLLKAISLINTLIDQISEKQGQTKETDQCMLTTDDGQDLEKENQHPALKDHHYHSTTERGSDKGMRLKKKFGAHNFNTGSQQELKNLISVIKRAKANNESLRSTRNNMDISASVIMQDSNFQNSSIVSPHNDQSQLPPLSGRSVLSSKRGSSNGNLMKQVLNRLHKLNQCKQGLSSQQKDEINQSMLALCDLII